MNPTATVLFAGGGGVEAGLISAGIDCPQRVEFNADICAVNEANFGSGVICAPVESVDLSRLAQTDYLWASPPCQSHSVARSKKLAARGDEGVGIHILGYVRVLRPRAVCIENVPPYANSPVFAAIVQGLHAAGYRSEWSIVNAADFGVPQTRKRLILRAVREGETLLPLTPTHTKNPAPAGLFGPALLPWNGWYGAVEDILDTLPESQFAEWQMKRLPKELFGSVLTDSCVNTIEGREATCGTSLDPSFTIKADAMRRICTTPTAILIEGDAAGDCPPTCGTSEEPSFTLKTSGGGRVHRALLMRGDNAGQEWGKGFGDGEGSSPSLTGSANPKAFLCGVQGEGGELARDGVPPSPTITTAHDAAKYRAFITDGRNASRDSTIRRDGEAMFTVTADALRRPASDPKAWLGTGRVVAMTPRALARFQSFLDTFILPPKRTLASKVIGNAVPPKLAEAIGWTLPSVAPEQS